MHEIATCSLSFRVAVPSRACFCFFLSSSLPPTRVQTCRETPSHTLTKQFVQLYVQKRVLLFSRLAARHLHHAVIQSRHLLVATHRMRSFRTLDVSMESSCSEVKPTAQIRGRETNQPIRPLAVRRRQRVRRRRWFPGCFSTGVAFPGPACRALWGFQPTLWRTCSVAPAASRRHLHLQESAGAHACRGSPGSPPRAKALAARELARARGRKNGARDTFAATCSAKLTRFASSHLATVARVMKAAIDTGVAYDPPRRHLCDTHSQPQRVQRVVFVALRTRVSTKPVS